MPPVKAWAWNTQLLAAGRRFHGLLRDGGSYSGEDGLMRVGGGGVGAGAGRVKTETLKTENLKWGDEE